MDVDSEYDMVSVNNVYIDNADEDSENSSATELLNDTMSPPKRSRLTYDTTQLSKALTHYVNTNSSNTDAKKSAGTFSSDTIVVIDSESEDEMPGLWLNAFKRKICAAQQKDSSQDVSKVPQKRSSVDDCIIIGENINSDSDSTDDLDNKATTSPEVDLGYCEGDDVDDNPNPNPSTDNGFYKTPTTSSVDPSTSSEITATPVSKSLAVGKKSKQNRKYYCTDCRAVFSELHEHEQTVGEEEIEKRFACDFCHEEFQSQLAYSKHGQSCARRCTCQFCGCVFDEIVKLKQHLFTEHALSTDTASTSNIPPVASSKSQDTSQTSSGLDSSIISEQVEQKKLVNSTIFQCNVCSSVFSNACNLKRHRRSKHFSPIKRPRRKNGKYHVSKTNKKRFCQVKSKCVIAPGKSTNSTSTVSQKQKSFTCDFCQKQFMSMTKYSAHRKKCKVRSTCPFCGKVFQVMKELRKHMLMQHDLSDDEYESTEVPAGTTTVATRFQCTECELILSTANNLQKHIKTQHFKSMKKQKQYFKAKSRFFCSVCNINLYNAQSFRKHQRKHPTKIPKSENKRRNVPACQRKRKKAKLSVKKYKCNECGLELSNAQNLKRHKNTHRNLLNQSESRKEKEKSKDSKDVGDKKTTGRFCCGICGDYYNHLFNLERHAMIHSEATPYQCQICFTRFSQLQHLQMHFEKFHIMDG